MKIFIPKESRENEHRVALTPFLAKELIKKEHSVYIQKDAGLLAGFINDEYVSVGAVLVSKIKDVADAQVILKVNPPTASEIKSYPKNITVLSFLYAHTAKELVADLCKRNITSFSMDAIPRISRTQKMDALSSQANLAGYKTVMIGANELDKVFPLMMTAAGTIKPARVLIFGAGVAGLQAAATAKRLGAIVEVTDVRKETKEQVESVGAIFLNVESIEEVKTEGGYAKEVSNEFLEKQQELIKTKITQADLVITTALVIGKKAPILVTKEMIASMKKGSVIVDMAIEAGGNCVASKMNEIYETKNGVKIVALANLPSLLAKDASELYAKNITELLFYLANKDGFTFTQDDEVVKGCLITHQGEVVHAIDTEKK